MVPSKVFNLKPFINTKPLEINKLSFVSSDCELVSQLIQALLIAFKGTAGINIEKFLFGVLDSLSGNYLSQLNPYIEDLLVLMQQTCVRPNQVIQMLGSKN